MILEPPGVILDGVKFFNPEIVGGDTKPNTIHTRLWLKMMEDSPTRHSLIGRLGHPRLCYWILFGFIIRYKLCYFF